MKPAEVFPLSAYIMDELEARGMTMHDLANRIGISLVALRAKLRSADMAWRPDVELLASTFDINPEYFQRLADAGLGKV